MRKLGLFMGVMLLAFSGTGCGKKEAVVPSEEIVIEENTETAVKEYAYESMDGTKITIHSTIASDFVDQANIYSCTPIVKDEAYIKDFAKKLFDGGNYEVLKPYFICSEDELFDLEEAEREKIDETLGTESEKQSIVENTIIQTRYYCVENTSEETIYSRDESLVMDMPENAMLVHLESEKYGAFDTCRLRGYINGQECELFYYNIPGNYFFHVYATEPTSKADVYWNGEESGDNICKKEDIQSAMQDLLKRMELDEFELQDFVSRKEGQKENGYLGVANRQIGVFGSEYLSIGSIFGEDDQRSYMEGVVMEMDENGLVQMLVNHHYEIGKPSEAVNLLSQQEIETSISKSFDHCDILNRFITVVLNSNRKDLEVEQKLMYMPLWCGDAGWQYVPVWTLVTDWDMGVKSENIYRVNSGVFSVSAVDGERIEFYKEDTADN
ncbi:MAG: hypothetical protein Q4D51_06515 [Eubacteriales bacterium]|nr:hypothetical protein [Eubacteriales bacterium]